MMHGKSGNTVNRGPVNRELTVTIPSPCRYLAEAEWSKICYNYLIAVDDRNIKVVDRLKKMTAMWNKLVEFCSIPCFPPITSSVPLYKDGMKEDGMPKVNFKFVVLGWGQVP